MTGIKNSCDPTLTLLTFFQKVLLNADITYKKCEKRKDIVSLNGPSYRNFLENEVKSNKLDVFEQKFLSYIGQYNNVASVEISEIKDVLSD